MVFDIGGYMFLGSVPIVMAAVQLAKQWVLDTRWYAVISLLVGIAFNVSVSAYLRQPLFPALIMGMIAGFSAAGIYSAGSTARESRFAAVKARRPK